MRVVPLRRVADVNPATPEFDRLGPDDEVTFMPLETVWADDRVDFSRRAAKATVATGYTRFRNGDVLVPKVTPTFQAGRTAVAQLATAAGAGTTELHVIRARPGVSDQRFLAYVCRSKPFLDEGVSAFQGVAGLQRVPDEYLRSFAVANLPLEGQRRIADFLDTETARIDGLTKMRSDELDLLAQRRSAVVRDLVIGATHQGRKSSTLPWCDSIPQGWDVVPLKYVAAYGSGHTPSRTRPEYWVDCDIPWISLFDVGKMRDPRQLYLSETEQQISQLGVANSSATLHPKGTVVLSRTASVGFATIMGTDMAVSQHFATWTCGPRLSPEYLLHLLRTMAPLFDSLKVGTTNVTVFMPDLLALRVPLPSLAEQRDIAARIGEQTAEIDKFADALERQVELLRERRQALITAAVTGQFDITTASRSQRPVHSP